MKREVMYKLIQWKDKVNRKHNASAPNQLPKTGISELAGLAGTGSLGYALYAYIVSRKNR